MKIIWHRWTKNAQQIGNLQIKLLFSLLYFIVLTPLGIISSFFSDFLSTRKTTWSKIEDNTSSLEKMGKQ